MPVYERRRTDPRNYNSGYECTGVVQEPGESWLDTELRLRVVPVTKWSVVRVDKGDAAGAVGFVFYTNGNRLGIATSQRKVNRNYADVVWADVRDVVVVADDTPLKAVSSAPASDLTPAEVVIPF